MQLTQGRHGRFFQVNRRVRLLESGQGHFLVQWNRCRDDDEVEVFLIGKQIEIAVMPAHPPGAQAFVCFLQPFGIRIGHGNEPDQPLRLQRRQIPQMIGAKSADANQRDRGRRKAGIVMGVQGAHKKRRRIGV